jgi:hypothetical protein
LTTSPYNRKHEGFKTKQNILTLEVIVPTSKSFPREKFNNSRSHPYNITLTSYNVDFNISSFEERAYIRKTTGWILSQTDWTVWAF